MNNKIELYEIWDKRLNIKIVVPKKDFPKLDIVITEGQIWIALKRKNVKR